MPAVGPDRRREFSAGVAAFVAHILFLTLAPRTPPIEEIEPPPEVTDVAADTTIEIDSNGSAQPNAQVPSPVPRAGAAMTPPTTAHGEIQNSPPNEMAPPLAPMPAPDDDAEPESEPEKPAPVATETAPSTEPDQGKPSPTAPPGDEYSSLPPADSIPAVPGLSGPLWSVPGVVPPTALPKPAPTTIAEAPTLPRDVGTRVLTGTLHTRDKSLGLDVPGAGVVAGTIADAMRNSALTDTKGTFEVKLGAEGNVESVRFVGSNDGDATQWAAVAEAARRSLAGRTLQMGTDKQPVTVVVKVESKVQYPAGTKKVADIKPICANDVVEQIAQAIEGSMQTGGMVHGIRDDQGHFIPYSELDDERRIKFCIPIGVRGTYDLSNIGAHMTNNVSTSFQVKRSGEQALPAEAPLPVDRRAPWLPVDPGKVRAPPPPPKKKNKKKRPRRGSFVPVQPGRLD